MKSIVIGLLIVAVLCGSVWGVSIAPQIVEQLRRSGQLETIAASNREAQSKGVWKADEHPYRFGLASDVDTLHCLIILVDFDDMTHESGLHSEPPDFDTLLFSLGVMDPGSMADFYDQNSYGQAYLTGQVTQWYRMPEPYSYYVDGQRGFGSYPHNAQKLTEDAVNAADSDIDFSLYDNNGDGWVDALFVVHAGPGYEDTGNLNYIHSHAWVTSQPMWMDSVRVYSYSMEPEETAGRQLETIGVFCHEFGHVLGLPDLYDYDYDSQGVGIWSVMAGGSWGGGGAVPVQFDGWSKYSLGWVVPTIPSDNMTFEQIDAAEYNADSYILYGQGNYSSEYFVVENRQRRLFDVSLPGGGLLIYHIDDNAPDNNNQDHYHVAVEQADGRYDLEHNIGGNSSDPWPGSADNRSFDDTSTPNSRFYNRQSSEVSVSNISDNDSSMTADLNIFFTTPFYQLENMAADDIGGNNNGRPEPGETCSFVFSAINTRAVCDSLIVTLSCADSSIVIIDSLSRFGFLPNNEPFDNSSDNMSFSVPADYGCSFVNFNLDFSALGGSYHQSLSGRLLLGNPNLVLIDDDGGIDVDSFYTQALDSINHPYDIWNIAVNGSPDSIMGRYDYAVWFTGNVHNEPMPVAYVNAIINYIAQGGKLLITSQDIVQQLSERGGPQDTLLLRNYLKVAYNATEIDHRILGRPWTPFDSLRFFTSGSGGAWNQDSEDNYIVLPGGIELLRYQLGSPAAVGVISNYAVITAGFGMEGINDDYTYFSKRRVFMSRALQFLSAMTYVDEGKDILPEKTSLSQNYPNPFNPATQIEFDLTHPGNVTLAIYDLLGRTVGKPVDRFLQAGHHAILWDGSGYPSGVYFYRLSSNGQIFLKRMTLLK